MDELKERVKAELRVKENDVRFRKYDTDFEKDVMLYLRNLAVWKERVGKQLETLQDSVIQLGQRVNSLGCANSEAFKQVKTVCERLANVTDETRENLDEYGGIITASTFNTLVI